jgi:hypothetical protein
MDELIRTFIANRFADFEGLQITGAIPIKQELLNEAIAAFLRDGQSAATTGATPVPGAAKSPSPMPPIPPALLLEMVRRAEVKATDGKITLEFEIRR